jgi:hypothetical protein
MMMTDDAPEEETTFSKLMKALESKLLIFRTLTEHTDEHKAMRKKLNLICARLETEFMDGAQKHIDAGSPYIYAAIRGELSYYPHQMSTRMLKNRGEKLLTMFPITKEHLAKMAAVVSMNSKVDRYGRELNAAQDAVCEMERRLLDTPFAEKDNVQKSIAEGMESARAAIVKYTEFIRANIKPVVRDLMEDEVMQNTFDQQARDARAVDMLSEYEEYMVFEMLTTFLPVFVDALKAHPYPVLLEDGMLSASGIELKKKLINTLKPERKRETIALMTKAIEYELTRIQTHPWVLTRMERNPWVLRSPESMESIREKMRPVTNGTQEPRMPTRPSLLDESQNTVYSQLTEMLRSHVSNEDLYGKGMGGPIVRNIESILIFWSAKMIDYTMCTFVDDIIDATVFGHQEKVNKHLIIFGKDALRKTYVDRFELFLTRVLQRFMVETDVTEITMEAVKAIWRVGSKFYKYVTKNSRPVAKGIVSEIVSATVINRRFSILDIPGVGVEKQTKMDSLLLQLGKKKPAVPDQLMTEKLGVDEISAAMAADLEKAFEAETKKRKDEAPPATGAKRRKGTPVKKIV